MNRWFRLAVVSLATVICAGLIPGQSLFIELFVNSGVYAYLCDDGKQNDCKAQNVAVSAAFNSGQYISIIGILPGGLLFDRYGGRWLAILGAGISAVGQLMVLLPVHGAATGSDASTANILPVSLLLADTGSLLNSFSLYSLLYDFPEFNTLIIALMTSTYMIAGLLPNVIELIISQTGCTLFDTIAWWTILTCFSTYLCYLFVPTQEETRAKARAIVGIDLPQPAKACTYCKEMKKAQVVLNAHQLDNLFFGISTGIAFVFNTVYVSFLGLYGHQMLGSKEAEEALPSLSTTLTAVVGGTITPLLSAFADRSRHTAKVLSAVLTLSCTLSTATVLGTTWWSQITCIICCVLFQALFQVVITQWCLAFCLPTQIGTVTGMMASYMTMFSMLFTGLVYVWIDQVHNSDLPGIMFSTSTIGSLGMFLGSLRVFTYGQPTGPVITPDDEAEYAQPFGCQSLEQVLYVMHEEDSNYARMQLLKRMTSADPAKFKELLRSVDVDRLDELGLAEELSDFFVAEEIGDSLKSPLLTPRAQLLQGRSGPAAAPGPGPAPRSGAGVCCFFVGSARQDSMAHREDVDVYSQ